MDIINTTLMNTNYDDEIYHMKENKYAMMYQSMKVLWNKLKLNQNNL